MISLFKPHPLSVSRIRNSSILLPPKSPSLSSSTPTTYILRPSLAILIMSQQRRNSSTQPARQPPVPPKPSSSVVLVSSQNKVLLLHRVKTSSSFASAHVFPGGNIDPFHDGELPPADSPKHHEDGLAYRMGAIRECFEETGILLAKRQGELVNLSVEDRDEARKKVYDGKVTFKDFLASVNATPDLDGLIPFTRWITPPNVPKRFTTQMYLYLLPLTRTSLPSSMLIPTPDNGVEHTAANFSPASTFLSLAAKNEIILFPPQAYLLALISRFFTGESRSLEEGPLHLAAQRKRLLAFLRRVPMTERDKGKDHHTAQIPWSDKVMSPQTLLIRNSDKRVVLGLDKPGLELKDSERGGDWERVALVKFGKGGPTDVEIRMREDVLREEKQATTTQEKL